MNEKVYIAVEMTKLIVNQDNKDNYRYSMDEIANIYNTFYNKLKKE